MTKSDNAARLMYEAYTELAQSGETERFMDLAADIQHMKLGAFFGSFGQETGCFFQIIQTDGDIRLKYGTRRFKQSWVRRLLESWKESWAILRGRDTEYSIHLHGSELTRFKQVLRHLEMQNADE